MLFPDASCLPENTLKRHQQIGMFDIIRPDWVGIIVLTSKMRIYFDGIMNFSGLPLPEIIALLDEIKAEVSTNFVPRVYEHREDHLIVIPIRKTDRFWAFYLYIRQNVRFHERDFEWLQAYSKLSYQNTLLNNEVAQERAYIENVFDSTESAILAIDLNGDVVAANDAVANIFGLTKEDFIGKHYFEYVRGDYREEFVRSMEKVIRLEEKQALNEVLFDGQDSQRILNMVLSPLRNSKNRVCGIVLVGTDITDLRFMEHAIEQNQRFGVLGEVAAGIAHDVKNPLMNIRGCARILRQNRCTDKEQRQMYNIIIHEVDRINDVVEQMLSFGNVTKSNPHTLVSLNEVLENCVRIINRQKNGKDVRVVCDLDRDAPIIRANNVSLQQVFFNILVNAMEAIETRGEIVITTRYQPFNKRIWIQIRDTGIGIGPENLGRIWDPYYTTKSGGTGLGLFLVKRVLEQCGTELEIQSTLGVGTTITLLFPCGEEEEHAG